MTTDPMAESIQALLAGSQRDDQKSIDHLTSLLYDELRRIARQRMRRERSDHTLRTTALVNEAYLRLVGSGDVSISSRVHFLAIASQQMRRILVDHARHRGRAKRGGDAPHVALLDDVDGQATEINPTEMALDDVLVINDALERLAALDTRKARMVELHLFGGLTYAELAEAMTVSAATVHRELRLGRAWLRRSLASS